MILNYIVAGTAGTWTLLFDSGGASPLPAGATGMPLLEQFKGAVKPNVQKETVYGSSSGFRSNRGNVVATNPWLFDVQYGSLAAALASMLTMCSLVNQKLHLQVIQDATVFYLPNAQLDDYQYQQNGVSMKHSFNTESDAPTTTSPV